MDMNKELATEIVEQVKAANPGVSKKKLQTLVGMEYNKRLMLSFYNSGYKVSEICKEMGVNESTVRKVLHEALTK